MAQSIDPRKSSNSSSKQYAESPLSQSYSGSTGGDPTSSSTDPIDAGVGSVGLSTLPSGGSSLAQKLKQQQPRREGARPVDILVSGTPAASGFDGSSPPRGLDEHHRSGSPFSGAAPASSPGRFNAMRASHSPRHLSPATSQIFERDVQEPTSIASTELSPAIPSHIQTEDHIPPVLEASSLAITDSKLGPDEVEIVRHTAHVPAATTLADSQQLSSSTAELGGTWDPALASSTTLPGSPGMVGDETASTYGAVDPMDPRRLSFISFADIVNADHQDNARESMAASSMAGLRSASPARSPLSSAMSARNSPPLSMEVSPTRGAAASISSAHGGGQIHGELTIETMRQTLQKTGQNDMGGMASQPMSAVSTDESGAPRTFLR